MDYRPEAATDPKDVEQSVQPATGASPVRGRSAGAAARGVFLRRLKAGAVLICCVAVLGLARYLTPDPSGLGTHTALGLQRCGFFWMTGRPCPTCGMTTAFAEMMHGRPVRSFIVQPAGALLCLATILTGIVSLTVLVTGRGIYIPWYRIEPRWIVGAALVIFLGAWVYKMWAVANAGSPIGPGTGG